MIFTSVVFPLPFSPSSTMRDWLVTLKSAPLKSVLLPAPG